ncbi:hypothetical protein ACFQGA_16725 [Marinobacter koreensis]
MAGAQLRSSARRRYPEEIRNNPDVIAAYLGG